MQCVWVDEQQGAAREGRGRKQRGSGGVQEKNDDCGCGDCLTAQSPVSVLTNCPLARHVSNVLDGEYHALLHNSLGDGVYRCLYPRNTEPEWVKSRQYSICLYLIQKSILFVCI